MAFQEYLPQVKEEKERNSRKRSAPEEATLKVKRGIVTLGLSGKYLEEKRIDLKKGIAVWFDPETTTLKLASKEGSQIKPQISGRGIDISLGRILKQYGLTAEQTVYNLEIALHPKDHSLLICLEGAVSERKTLKEGKALAEPKSQQNEA